MTSTCLEQQCHHQIELLHGGMVYQNVVDLEANYNPPEMGMYTNLTDFTEMQSVQAYAYNESQLTSILLSFTSQVNYPLHESMSYQDSQGTNINFY
jgi:hypothetical protein